MPTFCRHNRFIERCPICSKTLPGAAPAARAPVSRRGAAPAGARPAARRQRRGEDGVRVRRETRAADDGYRCGLVPGLRASADARRLAEELAFSSARLLALAADPPGLFADIRARAAEDIERATWECFLLVYLSPLQDGDPYAGIRAAIAATPRPDDAVVEGSSEDHAATVRAVPSFEGIPLGPRSSVAGDGAATLVAYVQWVARGGRAAGAREAGAAAGGQLEAFTGDPQWSPARRFERVYERLALPGLSRAARYDLLVTLGWLGLYPLTPDSLHLGGARGTDSGDPTTAASKRAFGIADAHLLERRADALAAAADVPIETLDLALANWAAPQRATLGMPPDAREHGALERALGALEL